jgi:hypothetical protein
MLKIAAAGATALCAGILCTTPYSLSVTPQGSVSLSLDRAAALIGHPLTPMSVAGVHRRAERRAYRRGYYGGAYAGNYGYGTYSQPYGYGTYQPYAYGYGTYGMFNRPWANYGYGTSQPYSEGLRPNACHVRFGSQADISLSFTDVRFPPKADIS